MNKILLVLAVFCFSLTNCSNEPEFKLVSSPSTSESVTTQNDGRTATLSTTFSFYKYWTMYRGRSGGIFVSHSPNGVDWLAEKTTPFSFTAGYFKMFYWREQLHVLYEEAGNYWLRKTIDGTTWSAREVLQIPLKQTFDGWAHPTVAIINDQLHVILLDYRLRDIFLTVYRYNSNPFSQFTKLADQRVAIERWHQPKVPAYAYLNGKHYVFFTATTKSTLNVFRNDLYAYSSTDLITWSKFANKPLIEDYQLEMNSNIASWSGINATTFGRNIFLSYVRSPDNRIMTLLFDETISAFNPCESGKCIQVGSFQTNSLVPITHDATKLLISYGGLTSAKNYIASSSRGTGMQDWATTTALGYCQRSNRDIVVMGYY